MEFKGLLSAAVMERVTFIMTASPGSAVLVSAVVLTDDDVAPLQGGRVPGGLEGAGRAAAGGRMAALHRDDGGEDLPAPPAGTERLS